MGPPRRMDLASTVGAPLRSPPTAASRRLADAPTAWTLVLLALAPWPIGGCNWRYGDDCTMRGAPSYTEIEGDRSQFDATAWTGPEVSVSQPSDCSEEDREAWRVGVVVGPAVDEPAEAQEAFFVSVSDELAVDGLAFRGGVAGCAERFQLRTDDWSHVETIAQVVVDRAREEGVGVEVTIVVSGIAW
ncbi:MAG: hypothetical protein AAF721_16130, partial [Myxococcota bacterium]